MELPRIVQGIGYYFTLFCVVYITETLYAAFKEEWRKI